MDKMINNIMLLLGPIFLISVLFVLFVYILKKKRVPNNKMIIVLFVIVIAIILFFYAICHTDSEHLGAGFIYSDEHKHITGKIDIPPVVISYDYDEFFIVVKQKPTPYDYAIYDEMDYIYPFGRDRVYYWIINKKEQKVFGPLDFDDFQQLRDEFEISDKLVLR